MTVIYLFIVALATLNWPNII